MPGVKSRELALWTIKSPHSPMGEQERFIRDYFFGEAGEKGEYAARLSRIRFKIGK
jgi:hypothetical protein